MLFSSIVVNRLSNCLAVSRSASGESVAASRRMEPSAAGSAKNEALIDSMAMASDDDQLRAQRAGFLQRLEDGHQIAGRSPDLIHRAHDLVQVDARVEHEHARVILRGRDLAARRDNGVAT